MQGICDSCGSHDEHLQEDSRFVSGEQVVYGHLCGRCYALGVMSRDDLMRPRKLGVYLERTRSDVQAVCKFCGKPLEQTGSPRRREFCDDVCKQRDYRARKRNAKITPAPAIAGAAVSGEEVDSDQVDHADLERDLLAAQARIRELEQQLDVEKRFLIDTHAYAFKSWLKKQHRAELPPIGVKMLEQDWFEPRGSRSIYEATLRRAGYSAEELQAFRNLWKLMLLEHPYQS